MANINGQSSRSWETLLLPSWHRGAGVQSTLLVFMRLPLWFLSPELITFPHIAPFNQAPARRASVCERSKRKTLHVQSASSQSTWPSKSARSPSQGRLLRWVSMSMPRLAWNPHCPNLLSWGWCYRGCQLVSALPFFGDANKACSFYPGV